MPIVWLAAFADVPQSSTAAALAFWAAVTATVPSGPHGDYDQYIPLAGAGEDPYLWLQAVDRGEGDGGWHPDLMVDDLEGAVRAATLLGASAVRTVTDLVTLQSPAGAPFCLVASDGESRLAHPRQWRGGHRSLFDQICLDIPAAQYEEECCFWESLTGWERRHGARLEFDHLIGPSGMPLRVLLQRLDPDDDGPIRAHADLACDDVGAERERHERLGAKTVRVAERWTTMRDPAGLLYCITDGIPGGN